MRCWLWFLDGEKIWIGRSDSCNQCTDLDTFYCFNRGLKINLKIIFGQKLHFENQPGWVFSLSPTLQFSLLHYSPEAGLSWTTTSQKRKRLQDVQRTRDALCHIEHFETGGEKPFHTAVSYLLGNFALLNMSSRKSNRQNALGKSSPAFQLSLHPYSQYGQLANQRLPNRSTQQ